MRVLLCGAGGFIGSYITAALLDSGHEVLGGVRRPREFLRRFPKAQAVRVDFHSDTQPESWLSRLQGVDAVINCVGILQERRGQRAETIHYLTPCALFDACYQLRVRRVIQISAVSADEEVGTTFASTKLRADNALRALDLDWVVIRPSLVYGRGSHGGTSLLRGLSALPWIIPLPDKGDQPFRPIHARDLSAGILRILENSAIRQTTLEPGGPDVLTLRKILMMLRRWLGLKTARCVRVPLVTVRWLAKLGDLSGAPVVNSTSFRQLQHGNLGDPRAFVELTRVEPDSMGTWLQREPSEIQDRWHARLYFLKPLLRYGLSLSWLLVGWSCLTAHAHGTVRTAMARPVELVLGTAALAIGVLVARAQRPAGLAGIQVLFVLGFGAGWLAGNSGYSNAGLLSAATIVLVLLLMPVWIVLELDR